MKKNEKNTTATTEPTTEKKVSGITRAKKDAVAPAEKKPAADQKPADQKPADQKPATDSKKPATDQKPATTETGNGKIAVVVVERDSLTYYKDVKAPTMILRSDDFGALLNSVLIARYADEASVKLTKSRKTLADAEKALKEYAGSDDGEIAALKAKIAAAQVNVKKFAALDAEIATARPEIEAEAAKVGSDVATAYNPIVTLFSLFYSIAAGIDDGKIKMYVVRGMHDLYAACTHYADQYENDAAIEWDATRKESFASIREKLTAIGSRLNGAADAYRKGYNFTAASKDVNRLIAYVTRYDKFARKTGKIADLRNKLAAFQAVVLATCFRQKAVDSSSRYEVEC